MEPDLVNNLKTLYTRGRQGTATALTSYWDTFIELWKWDRDYTRRVVERRRLSRALHGLNRQLKKQLQLYGVMTKFPLYWTIVWTITLFIIYMLGFISHQLNLFGTRSAIPPAS